MQRIDENTWPAVDPEAFVAEGAVILGEVSIGKDCSIWYHTIIRADRAPVYIGEGSNVQDNAVIHMDYDLPVHIGRFVTIGHSAIVHGAQIGDYSLIGMGAILMNGCVIGQNCIIAAGAVVTQNMQIPDNAMVMGTPAKIVRSVTEQELAHFKENAESYIAEAKKYRRNPPKLYRG